MTASSIFFFGAMIPFLVLGKLLWDCKLKAIDYVLFCITLSIYIKCIR